MRIWGWKLTLVPPLTWWLMWSPYFLGAKRAAAHLRVSTRKRATLQFSCVAVSAISIHSLKNLSACASRARVLVAKVAVLVQPPVNLRLIRLTGLRTDLAD